jgi:hypothetical protein
MKFALVARVRCLLILVVSGTALAPSWIGLASSKSAASGGSETNSSFDRGVESIWSKGPDYVRTVIPLATKKASS